MTFGDAIGLGREALFVAIVTAAPILLLSMVVGLVVWSSSR
jgi:flagellar biosynthesis protein FliQ